MKAKERPPRLPRVLVIDDLFGRISPSGSNLDRENLCAQLLLVDSTGDAAAQESVQRIRKPIAEAVFFRGQRPVQAVVGDDVRNDLESCITLVESGWKASQRRGEPPWALVLLDLCFYTGRVTTESNSRSAGMPDGRPEDDDPSTYFGLTVLERIHERFPGLPVVILSSMPREEVSRRFTRLGALGFLPRGDACVREKLEEYLWRHGLTCDSEDEIIGTSIALLSALREARRAAASRRNMLIRGETGTGKELLARYSHRCTADGLERPLVVIDSGALNAELFSSELFGHRRGAFTGATRDRRGRIAQATGGDLFLDEIGNIPGEVQTGILRVLESGQVTPVGAESGTKVDVRFLSATNEDIESRAATGSGFRLDLLNRLRDGGTLFLPPLRERLDDIPLLVERFVREAEQASPLAMQRDIDPFVFEALARYEWPGNIRDLRSRVFEAIRNNPDVEHLVLVHINLPTARPDLSLRRAPREEKTPKKEVPSSLEELADQLGAFRFDSLRPAEIVGKLPRLERAYAELLARYLRAALLAHRKHTPAEPEGRLVPTPSAVGMTGDASMSTTKAYDLIIRIRHLPGSPDRLWESDSILREAYETAIRKRRPQIARRKSSRRKNKNGRSVR